MLFFNSILLLILIIIYRAIYEQFELLNLNICLKYIKTVVMKNRREIKKHVFSLLSQEAFDDAHHGVGKLPPKECINPLFSAICRPEERLRWFAISCFGAVLGRLVKDDPEAARIVMRRFLWSLNDESGGIGWGAPESMAESMISSTLLRKEYLHMLVSYAKHDGEELFQDGNYLELPELQRGLLWGIERVSSLFPEDFENHDINFELGEYLTATDTTVRGLALKCIINLKRVNIFKEQINSVKSDNNRFRFYKNGAFSELELSTLATSVL